MGPGIKRYVNVNHRRNKMAVDPLTGADFEGGEEACDEFINFLKNNWRGATIPSAIQPGMGYSRNTDDRFTQRVSAGQDYLIFQGDPLCMDNEVLCADNNVLVWLPV